MSAENANHISPQDYSDGLVAPTQKVSKAARRREKRAAIQRAQQAAAVANIQTNKSDSLRSIEMKKLESQLETRHLKLFEVPSDGDCLYQSIVHQLKIKNYPFHILLEKIGMPNNGQDFINNTTTTTTTKDNSYQSTRQLVRTLRYLASHYIRTDFEQYCDNVEKTSTWGGQIEIRALSTVLQIPIEILQAEGVPLVIGEEFSGPPITIIYHRYAFALGEHYNSCLPKEVTKDNSW
ncbi:unnamed protein product [Heterobilharzia americana]|nr:unnamed protein product [Heterobilharzia americana]